MEMDKSLDRKILEWFALGEVGASSSAMAMAAAGLKRQTWGPSAPYDADDFKRCLLLVKQIPEIRESFPAIAKLSPVWAGIIEHWDRLEALYVKDYGECSDLIQKIHDEARREAA